MGDIGATDGSPAPTVLMISPDRYLIRACQRLGVTAVIIYGQGVADAGIATFPDGMTGVFAEDHKDAAAVLGALLRAGLQSRHFDAVISANEYAIPLAALLASYFGCGGLPVDVAVKFRDKSLQKGLVRAAGVPVADYLVIDDIHLIDDLPELPVSPMVLKPVAGVGTRLTMVVRNADELRAAARLVAAKSDLRTFMLEKFIPNDELIVDGVVRDGELVFYSMGYYPEPCLAVVEAQASMTYCRFDPIADKDVFEEAGPLAERAIGALGLTDGVFHMELFRPTDGGPLTFGECAARRGAAMIFEEVLWKLNVDLAEETLRAALGWPPGLDIRVRRGAVGTTNVNAPAGVLLSIPEVADVLRQPGAIYARIEMPVGATIADQIPDAASRLAQVLVTADEPGQLLERFADIRSWFSDQLIVAPPKATHRTLRAWQLRTWPASRIGDEILFEPDDPALEDAAEDPALDDSRSGEGA
jgi:biotin carboxylase